MNHQLKAIEGKYEILDKISEGGMGAVYKVRHRLLDRVRVIKIMRPQFVADAEMRTRFIREARLASSLHHQGIAQVFDFAVSEDGEAFLVMEYVNGVTLLEVLKYSGPPSVWLTLSVIGQVLEALEYLHGKGVVHRDLSPDNIMVTCGQDGTPVAKLIDLGIARHVEAETELTAEGSFIGKVRYASPELFRVKDGFKIDARSDLYSIGVVLYEVLTGQHPLGKKDIQGYIAGHLFKEPKPFSETDPNDRLADAVRITILKCLAKDPQDRYQNAAQLALELSSASRHLEIDRDETAAILDRCFDEQRKRAGGDTQERLNARFARDSISGGATDLRALLDDARLEPYATAEDERTGPTEILSSRTRPVSRTESPDPEIEATELLPRESPDAGRPHKNIWRVTGIVVGIAAIALTLWFLVGPKAPVEPGVVIVDAQPWARLQSVVDDDGDPVDFSRAETPLRLSMPAGEYRLTLTRGDETREMSVSILAGETIERKVSFETIDADRFLDSIGLQK